MSALTSTICSAILKGLSKTAFREVARVAKTPFFFFHLIVACYDQPTYLSYRVYLIAKGMIHAEVGVASVTMSEEVPVTTPRHIILRYCECI